MINNQINIEEKIDSDQQMTPENQKNNINEDLSNNMLESKIKFNDSEEKYLFDQLYFDNISNVYKYFDKIKRSSDKLKNHIFEAICIFLSKVNLFDLTDKQFFNCVYLFIKLYDYIDKDGLLYKLLYKDTLYKIKTEFSKRANSKTLQIPWYTSFMHSYSNLYQLKYYDHNRQTNFDNYEYNYNKFCKFFTYDNLSHKINNELYNIMFYCGKRGMIKPLKSVPGKLQYNWNIYLCNLSHMNKELLIWGKITNKLPIHYYAIKKREQHNQNQINCVSMIHDLKTFYFCNHQSSRSYKNLNYYINNYIRMFYTHINKEANLIYNILKEDNLKVILIIRNIYTIYPWSELNNSFYEVKTIFFTNRGDPKKLNKIIKTRDMIHNKKNLVLNKKMKPIVGDYFSKDIIPNKHEMDNIEIYTIKTTKINKFKQINSRRVREFCLHYDLSRQKDKLAEIYPDIKFDNSDTESIVKRSYVDYQESLNKDN